MFMIYLLAFLFWVVFGKYIAPLIPILVLLLRDEGLARISALGQDMEEGYHLLKYTVFRFRRMTERRVMPSFWHSLPAFLKEVLRSALWPVYIVFFYRITKRVLFRLYPPQ